MVDGQIILADEVLTPDSSRFWPADQYRPGQSQPSYDKQYVRDYLESIHWNKQPPAPGLAGGGRAPHQRKIQGSLSRAHRPRVGARCVSLLDLLLGLIVGASVMAGFIAGFARVGIGFCAAIAGIVFGFWYYETPAAWIHKLISSQTASNVLGFLVDPLGRFAGGRAGGQAGLHVLQVDWTFLAQPSCWEPPSALRAER